MAEVFYSRTIPSALNGLRGVAKEAVAALTAGGWVEEDQALFARLCVEEAVVNAIEHGNRRDASRTVTVECIDEGNVCCIRVHDEGSGFAPEECGQPDCAAMGGRGLWIIRYCMDAVRYDVSTQCLEMRMRRKALGCGGDLEWAKKYRY